MSQQLSEIFRQYYQSILELLPGITTALIVFLIFIVFGQMFYRTIGHRIQRKWKDRIAAIFIAEASRWIFYLLGAVIALHLIGFGGIASGVIAGAGVGAIILGFAFKDIVENFLAGILLTVNRPFEIGDIVEADGHKGTVRGLDLRITHIRNAQGKDIYIPNSVIVKNTVINYTRDGNLRMEFLVGIAPESDLEFARKIILDTLISEDLILKDPQPGVLVDQLGEFTVDLKVLFWIDILVNRNLPDSLLGDGIRSRVMARVKSALDDQGIEMPSQVIEHKMYREGTLKVANV